MSKEIILILDDDLQITEALAMSLELQGRTVITCNDIEAAELIMARLPVSLLLSDIKLSGPFAYEGFDLIDYALKHSPGTRIALMTGRRSEEILQEGLRRGAMAVFQKPFEIAEIEHLLASFNQEAVQ